MEARLEALEPALPSMSVEALVGELDAAFAEFLDVALTEVVRADGQPEAARVVATNLA